MRRLIAGMSEKTITLDDALKLLALPRELGNHPDGKVVVAGQGRFGPYVKHGDEFRSLEDSDDVFTIGLPRALELLAAPKKSRGRRTATRTVLKEVGPHPRGGATINLLAGRYGPYVTDGTTNASLPKSMAPEQVTLEQAVELLAAREGAPKKGRAVKRAAGGARKTTRKRATTVRVVVGGGRRSRTRLHRRRRPAWFESSAVDWPGPKRHGRWPAAACRSRCTRCARVRPTEVHKTDRLAELVCSNSFRGDKLDNAVGLLKEEMRRLGSLVMRAAEAARVPAGAALAVDRDRFSQAVTDAIASHPLITLERREIGRVPEPDGAPWIIATGPLTSDSLSADIVRLVGAEHLSFYDAISPIVLAESIDRSKVFRQSRWDRSWDAARQSVQSATRTQAPPVAWMTGRGTT